jgi:RNA polymerase sigma-70 factor, ECF subfamily
MAGGPAVEPFWDLCRLHARKTYVGELALIGAGSVRSGSEKIPTIATADRQGAERRAEHAQVRAAQSGSIEAMETLYRRHWRPAYRAAYLIVRDQAAAEDIAQEAFLSALRSLDRFDRRRPFAPWLHRIVVNRAIDWSRARTLRREVGDADALTEPFDEPDSQDVGDALGRLSAEHRAVVVLRYLLGYTPGEIAKLLDLPRGTVNSRLRRALDQLADTLREDER